jgi:serine/threonine protein kinase
MPAALPENRCLSPETFRQFLANELAAELETFVLAHLETCPHCQELCDSVVRSDHLADVRSKLVHLNREKEPTAVVALRHELYGIDDTVSRAGESDTQNVPAVAAGELPRSFGGYELLEEIARGGMGLVYKARQTRLDRIVAVKMILAGEFASADGIRRFVTEAQAAANLDHPHIVPIYEVGEHEGRHFYSMGYVEGQSLSNSLSRGPLPPHKAAKLMRKIALAIAYAHAHGVIHRDLKPQNVLLDSAGEPRVTDFGLAKRLERDSELTSTGQLLGTPSYMPPEQARGDSAAIGPHSDIYGLGAILYCLLIGRPPFQAASLIETLKQVHERDPLPPRQLNSNIPRDLETIALKCLEKCPGHRYDTAQALADELDRYLQHRPILARPITRPERAWRWCKRNRVVAGLSAIATALVIGVATVSTAAHFREASLLVDLSHKTTDLNRALENQKHLTTEAVNARKDETKAKEDAQKAQLAERDAAQRLKQLQDLLTQRGEAAAIQERLLAEGAMLRQQITALEIENGRLQRAVRAVPANENEFDKDGKPNRIAIKENAKNKQERAKIQIQLAAVGGRGRQAQRALDAAESAYHDTLARTYKIEEQWISLADRFGRFTRAEHQAAMRQWDAWVTADASDIGPLLGRGLAHQHLGQPDLALADFNKAIEIVGTPKTKPGSMDRPLLVSLYCARGRLHLAAGRERESSKDFNTAFSVNPNRLSLFLFQGMADCAQREFAAAVLKFTKATQLYPDEPEGHRLLGLLYAACPVDSVRNEKKALESAQKACDLTKNADWSCLYALAAAKAGAKDFTAAATLAGQAADLTFDEHRAECLRCQADYQQQRPLRLAWK